MVKTYTIKTVDDFLNIPSDKIDVCIGEFGIALMLANRLGKASGLTPQMKSFRWVDDGKTEFTGRVTLPSGQVYDFAGDQGDITK